MRMSLGGFWLFSALAERPHGVFWCESLQASWIDCSMCGNADTASGCSQPQPLRRAPAPIRGEIGRQQAAQFAAA